MGASRRPFCLHYDFRATKPTMPGSLARLHDATDGAATFPGRGEGTGARRDEFSDVGISRAVGGRSPETGAGV